MSLKNVLIFLSLATLLLCLSLPVFAGLESVFPEHHPGPLVVVSATEEEEGITIRDNDLDMEYDEVEINPPTGPIKVYSGAASSSSFYKGDVPWLDTFTDPKTGEKMEERIRSQADDLFSSTITEVKLKDHQE